MTSALRQNCFLLTISKMAVPAGIFCPSLVGAADEREPLVAYPPFVWCRIGLGLYGSNRRYSFTILSKGDVP